MHWLILGIFLPWILCEPKRLQLQPNGANPPVSFEIYIQPDTWNLILEQHVATIAVFFKPEPLRIWAPHQINFHRQHDARVVASDTPRILKFQYSNANSASQSPTPLPLGILLFDLFLVWHGTRCISCSYGFWDLPPYFVASAWTCPNFC